MLASWGGGSLDPDNNYNYPANKAPLTIFRLSSDAEILLLSTD